VVRRWKAAGIRDRQSARQARPENADHRFIVNVYGARGRDIWTAAVDPDGSTQPLLAEPYSERDGRVSPDGRWISYVSDESGRPEVSVRNISGSPTRIVVSGDGGEQPVWRRDGAELFFVDPRGRLRSVSVRGTLDGLPAFGLPVELAVPPIGFGHWGHQYDVSPDGRRIYFMRRNEDQAPQDHRGHRLAFAAQMSTALSTATLPSPFICRASS
jgi:hypothetical protein